MDNNSEDQCCIKKLSLEDASLSTVSNPTGHGQSRDDIWKNISDGQADHRRFPCTVAEVSQTDILTVTRSGRAPSLEEVWNKISRHGHANHPQLSGSEVDSFKTVIPSTKGSTTTTKENNVELVTQRPLWKPHTLIRSQEHLNPITLVNTLESIVEQLPSSSDELPHFLEALGVQKNKRKLQHMQPSPCRRRKYQSKPAPNSVTSCSKGMNIKSS